MLLLTSAAFAAPSWTVQVDPLTTALGFVHVQVERGLGDWSIYAGPHLRMFDGLLSEGPEPYRGYGVESGFRWYPRGEAPQGPWLLARGVAAYATTVFGPPATGFAGYGSALGGWTAIVGERWVLSGGLGAQYLAYGVAEYGIYGLAPAAHTAVGVAF